MNKKISVLNFDNSNNSLGRAIILAQALNSKFQVEILGPDFGKGIWPPLREERTIKISSITDISRIKKILHRIDGDIIYAIKPKTTSFGYAILKKLISKKKVILDIDDWELGFFLERNMKNRIQSSVTIRDANNILYTFLMEKLIFLADRITVSNTYLQKKFGGTLIPHFRDTDILDPKRYKNTNLKNKLRLGRNKVILFLGTPRKHKGLVDIIKALDLLNNENITFLIVGATAENRKDIGIPYRKYLRTLGQQPFNKIAEFLSIADLVIINQSNTTSSVGQLPAKLFDAMSMEKPIIATDVSDLKNILKNCGFTIEPGNISELVEKIKYVLAGNKDVLTRARNARQICIENYSIKAVTPKLLKIFDL